MNFLFQSLGFLFYFLQPQALKISLTDLELHALVGEIDVSYNGQMELQDYLQVIWDTTFFNALFSFDFAALRW